MTDSTCTFRPAAQDQRSSLQMRRQSWLYSKAGNVSIQLCQHLARRQPWRNTRPNLSASNSARQLRTRWPENTARRALIVGSRRGEEAGGSATQCDAQQRAWTIASSRYMIGMRSRGSSCSSRFSTICTVSSPALEHRHSKTERRRRREPYR